MSWRGTGQGGMGANGQRNGATVAGLLPGADPDPSAFRGQSAVPLGLYQPLRQPMCMMRR